MNVVVKFGFDKLKQFEKKLKKLIYNIDRKILIGSIEVEKDFAQIQGDYHRISVYSDELLISIFDYLKHPNLVVDIFNGVNRYLSIKQQLIGFQFTDFVFFDRDIWEPIDFISQFNQNFFKESVGSNLERYHIVLGCRPINGADDTKYFISCEEEDGNHLYFSGQYEFETSDIGKVKDHAMLSKEFLRIFNSFQETYY